VAELAAAIEDTIEFVSAVESGQAEKLSLAELEVFAGALGVPVSELLLQ